MKILLPVYDMPDAELIIDVVCNYHWPEHSNFKTIHVLGSMPTEEAFQEAERQAQNFLAEVAERLQSLLPRAQVSTELLSGEPTYEIVSMASRWRASMIVMGYRTRSDLMGFLTGSVSKGVVMQAPCSVAIIKPDPNAKERRENRRSSIEASEGQAILVASPPEL